MAAAGDPFAPYGFLLNHLKPSKDGKGTVCAEQTPCGAPLLALPLDACWTPQSAAKECPQLGAAMTSACERNPTSELIKKESTWIAMHLLYERQRGDQATPLRKSHLATLPKSPESLLAWNDLDIEALKGSWWHDEALRRKDQVSLDLEALLLELGPAGASALGLDKAGYSWARSVLDQFGIQVMEEGGSSRTLLVPGLELVGPEAPAPTGTAGARLESGGAASPVLVFYAEKDFYPGELVGLSHGGLACCNGSRLAGCGWLLESNPWDSCLFSIPLRLDKIEGSSDEFGELIQGLTQACTEGMTDGRPEMQPGECMPPDALGGRSPVVLTDAEKYVLCEVVIRATRERLLPSRATLAYIGAALVADLTKQPAIMEAEREVEGVLNDECCERRALTYLQSELEQLLGKYTPMTKAGAVELAKSEASGTTPSRSARSLRLLATEQQLLAEVLGAVQGRLGAFSAAEMLGQPAPEVRAPAPPQAVRLRVPGGHTELMLPLEVLKGAASPQPSTTLAQALTQLGGMTKALEQLTTRFLTVTSAGAAKALSQELGVLSSCLARCPLGDPMAVDSVPFLSSKDDIVRLHGEATMALLTARLAATEWEQSQHKGSRPADKEALVRVITELASLRMRLLDFEAAHTDLVKGLELKPDLPGAVACAMSFSAQKPEVLAGPTSKWSAATRVLKTMKERLQELGYMGAGSRWSWPARMPAVRNMAAEPSAWSGNCSEKEIVEATLSRRPGALPHVTKPSKPDGGLAATHLDPSILPYVLPREQNALQLVDLIRLFMLQKPLPLGRAKDLLGADVCALLLKSSALTCIKPASAQLLAPEQAAALVPGASKGSTEEVFANIMLWPIDEDMLVAVDFEQAVYLEGYFEPVPYLGQDSRALMVGAPRTPKVATVLDASCGSGAQGITALKHYAQRATFVDSNPRAIRFATFSAYLNGFGDQCTFVEGSLSSPDIPKALQGAKFDAILSSTGCLPNPRGAVANRGPGFVHGGDDGERLLAAVVAKSARQLLAPEGRLVAAAMVPNVGSLGSRLVGWADAAASEPADLRAVVLRGHSVRDEEYVHLCTLGCPPAVAAVHLGALQQQELHTMSQALLLLRVPPAGVKVPAHAPRVETLPEHPGLWTDASYLQTELQTTLDGLVANAMLDESGSPPKAGDSLYTLDWNDGKKDAGGLSASTPIVRAGPSRGRSVLQKTGLSKSEYAITLDKTAGSNLGAQVNPGDGKTLLIENVLGGLFKDWNAANPRQQVSKGDRIVEVNGIRGSSKALLEECKQCTILQIKLRHEIPESGPPKPTATQRGEFVADACKWKDVAMHRLLGWSPPALCDWRWHKSALPLTPKQRGAKPSGYQFGMVELKGCRCPSEVKDALRSIGCVERFTFDKGTFKHVDKAVQVPDMATLLNSFDVLVVPLDSGSGKMKPLHELPVECLLFLEAVTTYVYSNKRCIRLVMVTCGCSGPSYAGMKDDGFGLPAATPLRGLFRCSRIENISVPLLHLDSDALCEPGRGKELVAQIECEVELSAPDVGFYKADVADQNRAILHTHREVAYRGGARFLPKLDLCARNPIFSGAKIAPLYGTAGEGVALITGGTGGLGILTAEALVEIGVKTVVLSSRSGKISRDYQGLGVRLEALRMMGATVELAACDQKEEKQVVDLLAKLRKMGPLKWIMNAAGIVLPQDPGLMEQVFEPKCLGAFYMHKHTLQDDIKTFMTYSSMSAGAGANDLSNYAAANTYVDELARLRQSQGLPATSIMFPEVEEAGMAADTIFVKGQAANIPPGTVKQTIKQVVNGTGPMAPCVAIIAQGYLIPRSPTMDSMLEPLKARVDKDLWDKLVSMNVGKKGR